MKKPMRILSSSFLSVFLMSATVSISPAIHAAAPALSDSTEITAVTKEKSAIVTFGDRILESKIQTILGKVNEKITQDDLLKLTTLSAGYKITSIKGLEFATNLEDIHLPNSYISDISPLSGLKKLKMISLPDNNIIDISPLKGLTNLTNLNLERNMIKDLTPLAGLTSLTRLALNENNISDISPLHALTNLEFLNVNDNYIEKLGDLVDLHKLYGLELHNNLVTDVSPLASIRSLKSINIGYNQVTDISPLKELDLNAIQINNTDISDLSVLRNMPSFNYLYWKDNPLTEQSLSFLEELKKREGADVYNYPHYASPKVFLNGQVQSLGTQPRLDLFNGVTMMPLRELFEMFGAAVHWDNATRTVTATSGENKIVIPLGSKIAQINNRKVEMETASVLFKEHTMIPLRFVTEAFGYDIQWNAKKRWIIIETD
ncbi:stalk domain-containing protein [Paenibacillus eucommiae]|uniref:Copper amine oxidase-like N-terminal domain-containing protein n=1 Tax=Paenibacillus eucommiae TaxID=1355755 RepID=A0ABS4IPC6_9BACL|nr:leucine-rich repeat domain-containing protein [Paenibacillus eucommiae]MBP1989020.1 hypothetical protein [Paenibacillus eucommiae]